MVVFVEAVEEVHLLGVLVDRWCKRATALLLLLGFDLWGFEEVLVLGD